MSTHNICFYGELIKIIPYHQIPTLSVLMKMFISLIMQLSSLKCLHNIFLHQKFILPMMTVLSVLVKAVIGMLRMM